MIPENIIEFFKKQTFTHVGTRDNKLRPREVMAWGMKADNDKQTLTVYIPQAVIEKTLSNLQSNGKIAVTSVEPFSHESYQFKGNYISHSPSTDAETVFQENYIPGYNKYYNAVGAPAGYLSRLIYKPSTAVTFSIEEIYSQTPGPNAGKKII